MLLLQVTPFVSELAKQGPLIGSMVIAIYYFFTRQNKQEDRIKEQSDKLESFLREDRLKMAAILENNTRVMEETARILDENSKWIKERTRSIDNNITNLHEATLLMKDTYSVMKDTINFVKENNYLIMENTNVIKERAKINGELITETNLIIKEIKRNYINQ
jgi:ribonuclease HII